MTGPFDDFKRWLLGPGPATTLDNQFENQDEDEDEDNPREPTEEEVARATQGLIQTARTAVHLKRVYPPAPHDEATSYIGGLPRMPADLAWPRHEKMGWINDPGQWAVVGEMSMNFAAQIDLAGLPWFPERVLLPREGALYFFVNTMYNMDHEGWVKVLYSPDSPAGHPIREPPADLMPIRGYDGDQPYPWLPIDDPRSCILDRYVLEPTTVQTYREDTGYCEQPWSLGRGHQAAKAVLDEAAMRTLEPPAPYSTPYPQLGLKDEAWPYGGLFVSAAVDILPHAAKGRILSRPLFEGPGMEEAAERTRVEHARIFDEAEAWRAKAAAPFEALSKTEHDAFRVWWFSVEKRFDVLRREAYESEVLAVKSWEAAGRQGPRPGTLIRDADRLRELLTRSTELALETCYRHSARTGTLIPSATTEHVKQVYRSGYRPSIPAHQILGHGLLVRDDPPDPDENVLLLQIAPDDGLHWLRILCIQVWIRPRDLAERRFERAYATLGK